MPAELPDWLDECRISSILSGNAYESTPAPFRAAIKTGIALTWFYFSPKAPRLDIQLENSHLGFSCRTITRPVDWTVIIFPPEFSAAARIAAAASLASVADVEVILAVCVAGEPTQPVLAALELCGIEDVFSLQAEKIPALLAEMEASNSCGSIIILHDGQLASLAAVIASACPRLYEEKKPPNIAVGGDGAFSGELLAFCHGNYVCNPDMRVDAFFGIYEPEDYRSGIDESAPLLVNPGCEGFWLFPGLGLEFFQQSINVFAMRPQTL